MFASQPYYDYPPCLYRFPYYFQSHYPTSMPSYVSEVSTTPTGTTTLLTPSTLHSIEQTFIELQNVPSTTTSQVTESGFVPPIVSSQTYTPPQNMVIKTEYSDIYSDDSSRDDPEWMPSEPSPKRMRGNGGNSVPMVTSTSTGRRTGPRGRRSDDDVSILVTILRS